MRVLIVAYPFTPVGAGYAGGAEEVAAILDGALKRRGHETAVVACEGSRTSGDLFAVRRVRGRIGKDSRDAVHAEVRQRLSEAIEAFRPDIVHMHGVDFSSYLPKAGPPVLVTLHLPGAWYGQGALTPDRGGTYFNFVSMSQAALSGRQFHVVENGIDTASYGARVRRRGYALCLGRVCPEKGFHIALDAARLSGTPLILAGDVAGFPEHRKYFMDEIAPRLDELRRFIGPAALERKRRLLSGARCVLIPSLVPETSSLVAMEAFASSTPVIAARTGALAEIIEEGVTGLFASGASGFAGAIREIAGISGERCRDEAARRFDSAVMAERYMDTYRGIIAAHAS